MVCRRCGTEKPDAEFLRDGKPRRLCPECAETALQKRKEWHREYCRLYHIKHQEEIRVRQAAYWDKNRELLYERARLRRSQDKETYNAKIREWRNSNKERVAENDRTWRYANRDKVKLAQRKYLESHREQANAKTRNRKAQLRAANGSHTAEDITWLYERQSGRCEACRKPMNAGYDVDHIVALSIGGANDRDNLQLLCKACNRRKSDKSIEQWSMEIGRLPLVVGY